MPTTESVMPFDPQRHHRRSIRLQGYDYAQAGAYFVTICAQDRACFLGTIVDSEVGLSPLGHCVAEAWVSLAERYEHVDLDAWVVMPNHFHGILVLGAADHLPGLLATRKPLGRLIGAFKTLSTKAVNEVRGTAGGVLWQRNFFDHIIRDEPALIRVRDYIEKNPSRWDTDDYHVS